MTNDDAAQTKRLKIIGSTRGLVRCDGCDTTIVPAAVWAMLSPERQAELRSIQVYRVRGVFDGLPYCGRCAELRGERGKVGEYGCGGGRRLLTKLVGDDNPWQQVALRAMEDAGCD